MDSGQIQKHRDVSHYDDGFWLKEIAYQLAVMNERAAAKVPYRDFLAYLNDFERMDRKEFNETHGEDISAALDRLVAKAVREAKIEEALFIRNNRLDLDAHISDLRTALSH